MVAQIEAFLTPTAQLEASANNSLCVMVETCLFDVFQIGFCFDYEHGTSVDDCFGGNEFCSEYATTFLVVRSVDIECMFSMLPVTVGPEQEGFTRGSKEFTPRQSDVSKLKQASYTVPGLIVAGSMLYEWEETTFRGIANNDQIRTPLERNLRTSRFRHHRC